MNIEHIKSNAYYYNHTCIGSFISLFLFMVITNLNQFLEPYIISLSIIINWGPRIWMYPFSTTLSFYNSIYFLIKVQEPNSLNLLIQYFLISLTIIINWGARIWMYPFSTTLSFDNSIYFLIKVQEPNSFNILIQYFLRIFVRIKFIRSLFDL